jgi:methanogenic corrinoid protein MtbC1
MSLDILDKQLDAVRARAAALQGNVSAQKRYIQEDPALSPTGKQEALDALATESRLTMEKLRAEEDKLALDKKASLERTVSGSVGTDSAAIINYRDAQDRADKLETHGEAARMMTRALNSGDKTLASAVAQAAVEKGWNDVYQPYAKQNPVIAEAVEDLSVLNRYFSDVTMVMSRAMAYGLSF